MLGVTSTGATGLSDYNSRIMAIEVTGLCRQDAMRTSHYTVKVPYSRLSQAMQRISRIGGKVASVTMVSSFLTEAEPAEVEAQEIEAVIAELEQYQEQIKSDSVAAEPPATSQTTKTIGKGKSKQKPKS